MSTFLTIIIPIYNMEKYLPECLASLQRQQFDSSVEILLIDDGSTDKSGQICENIAKEDPIFRVIHQENQGVAMARNRGLDEAQGKYIAWVDPDDYITDDWWKVLKPVLEKGPDIIFFDLILLQNGKIQKVYFDKASRSFTREELFLEFTNGKRMGGNLWSKIFSRKLFEQPVRFDKHFSFGEDQQALPRIIFPVQTCIYVHACLYVYRQHEASIIHDQSKLLSNYWLGVKLKKERQEFFRHQGLPVTNFSVLYAEYVFCTIYKENEKCQFITKEIKQHYKQAVKDLREYQTFMLKSKKLSLGESIKLLLIIYNLYSLLPCLKRVKWIIRWIFRK